MAHQTPKSRKQDTRRVANQGVGSIIRRDILAFLTSGNVRETFESIVIAFALAFLFRTFEAEAFVIPTGSMAPTLQGRHQNVECPMCQFPYRISASNEIKQETETHFSDVVSGTCPNCGYYASTNMSLGQQVEEYRGEEEARGREIDVPFNMRALELGEDSGSKNGDRILVSKYQYIFNEPERWDVFVFRYPHNSSRNYIKRLVGLPDESLMIHCGDIFTGKYISNEQLQAEHVSDAQLGFKIERKPPDKVLAMAQLVHDNNYQSDVLIKAGWPRCWNSSAVNATNESGAWIASPDFRSFRTNGSAGEEVFLRYGHVLPTFAEWEQVLVAGKRESRRSPQLIADACPYNSSYTYAKNPQGSSRDDGGHNWHVDRGPAGVPDTAASGVHWVGDLTVETEITTESTSGEVVLELVEGGHKFQCRIDLSNGLSKLSIDGGIDGFQSELLQDGELVFQTGVNGPGTYELIFANVDDQLILWVDGDVVAQAPYDSVENRIPTQADLFPVAIGSRGATVTASSLRVWRDVYYLAITMARRSSWDYGRMSYALHDDKDRIKFLSTPQAWSVFNPKHMSKVRFSLGKFENSQRDQFFALGDNSQQSKDSRLWSPRPVWLDPTAEFYVERELLIGKAVAIYWPLGNFGFVR